MASCILLGQAENMCYWSVVGIGSGSATSGGYPPIGGLTACVMSAERQPQGRTRHLPDIHQACSSRANYH